MKTNSITKLIVFISLMLFNYNSIHCQSRGDIAFTSFNHDGDDDFALVILNELPTNTTIYFTDYEWDENTTSFIETGSDGFLSWNTGNDIIKAGTIIIFTDIDNKNNPNFGVSIGSLTSLENMALLADGETLFAYLGNNQNVPTKFLTGYKNGHISTDLTGTNIGGDANLTPEIDFLEFNPTTSPDGGYYSGSRNSQTSYNDYFSLLVNKNNWIRNTSEGELLLPFSKEAFTTHTTSWIGITQDWAISSNWSNGIPTIDSNVFISSTNNQPQIKANTFAEVGNITINSNAALTILESLTTKGIATLNSSNNHNGVLIGLGNFNGYIKYNKYIKSTYPEWHLVSSPTENTTVVDFVTSNNLQLGSGVNTSQNVALAKYQNFETLEENRWKYYTIGETDHKTSIADTSDKLNIGEGYATSINTSTSISYTGTLKTDNVLKPITINISSGGNNYNLIGNPYSSYINMNTFLTDNTNITTTLWIWNNELGENGHYETKNLASNFNLAPGQAFFIEANSGTHVLFDKTNQNIGNIQVAQKTTTPYIKLHARTDVDKSYTEIYYLNHTTTKLDNGYDSQLFNETSSIFAIYSRPVATTDQTKNLAIQSLPNTNYENMIIPIGIKTIIEKEITFTAENLNLPTGIKVFLEDTKYATSTQLNNIDSEYKTIISPESNDTKRFFLHTTYTTLKSTNAPLLNTIKIYKHNSTSIKIDNLPLTNLSIIMFDMLGKRVFQTTTSSKKEKIISFSNLKKGIYTIQLKTDRGILNKKIFF